MFKKIIFFSLLILGLNNSLAAIGELNDLYGSPWEFIEDTFIAKPENAQNNLGSKATSFGLAGLGGIGGYFTGKKIYKFITKNEFDFLDSDYETERNKVKAKITGATTGILTGILSYQIIKQIQKNNIEYNILKDFVKNWHENKRYTPKELHQSFDQLNNMYNNNNSRFNDHSQDAIRLIKQAVYRKFPNKYVKENNKDKSFWDSKHLLGHIDFSFGGVINSIANLYRAITGR